MFNFQVLLMGNNRQIRKVIVGRNSICKFNFNVISLGWVIIFLKFESFREVLMLNIVSVNIIGIRIFIKAIFV